MEFWTVGPRTLRREGRAYLITGESKFGFTIWLDQSSDRQAIGHSQPRGPNMFFHDGYRSHKRVRSIVWGSRSVYRTVWVPCWCEKSHKDLFSGKTFLGKTFVPLEIKSVRLVGAMPSSLRSSSAGESGGGGLQLSRTLSRERAELCLTGRSSRLQSRTVPGDNEFRDSYLRMNGRSLQPVGANYCSW